MQNKNKIKKLILFFVSGYDFFGILFVYFFGGGWVGKKKMKV